MLDPVEEPLNQIPGSIKIRAGADRIIARAQHPEDAVEDTTVIHSWHAARLVGQQLLDGGPFLVGEFVAHDSSPSVWGLESSRGCPSQYGRPTTLGALLPESGPIMLELSFVVRYPKPT